MKQSRRAICGVGLGLIVAASTLVAPGAAQAATVGGLKCTITGTAANDVLRGTPGPDVICGLGGNDVIYGRDGDDVLSGGPGVDVIFGGDGDDVLFGGAGNDVAFGGPGDDTLVGGAGNDTLVGGSGDDDIHSDSSGNALAAFASNETRMWELDVQPRYHVSLPAGTRVKWGEFQGSSRCLARSSNGWITTIGSSQPDVRFLLEGSKSRECMGQTVGGRWQVTVDTPYGQTATVVVSANVTLPAPATPQTTGATTCEAIVGNITCFGGGGTQIFAPLPLIVEVGIGPFGG